jgi:hypothetical protein
LKHIRGTPAVRKAVYRPLGGEPGKPVSAAAGFYDEKNPGEALFRGFASAFE